MYHKLFHLLTSLILALVVTFPRVTPVLAAPLNDNIVNAEPIASLPASTTVDITGAGSESGEPQFCWFMNMTAWYTFTPTQTMAVSIDTSGSAIGGHVNVYRLDGSGIDSLSFVGCASFGIPTVFQADAGQAYYLQVGSPFDQDGNIQLNLQGVPSPANDNFSSATTITSLPFGDTVDTTAALIEVDEPTPSCASFGKQKTVWYAFTPETSGSISAGFNSISFTPTLAAYTGASLEDLSEVGCRAFGSRLTFLVDAGTTYYFQVGGFSVNEGGLIEFNLMVTPQPVVNMNVSVSDPSVFDTIQFCDSSFDPADVGIESWVWDFGDGTTSEDECPTHKFSVDGYYTAEHSVTTFDGRTGSVSQLLNVRTHDVSISGITSPKSATVGQTKAITVSIRNSRYPETVNIELYRSVFGGGFELISHSTQFIPARSGNRTTQFSFNYTFSPQDAQIGKVTFKAIVTIVTVDVSRDAFPGDNQAVSTPPTTVKR